MISFDEFCNYAIKKSLSIKKEKDQEKEEEKEKEENKDFKENVKRSTKHKHNVG